MADGDGARWNNHGGVPKHLIKIDGVPILKRTIDLLGPVDKLISAHDPRYAFCSA